MARFDLTRHLIEGIVCKTLRDFQRDPERSLRNLVDMGANFAKGRFQHRFMQGAQSMLADENSPFYQIARNAVQNISLETLKTFGVNLGYNSYTLGAKKIRQLEEALGINIPWIINMHYDGAAGCTPQDLDAVVTSAKKLGIYAYALFARAEDMRALEPMIKAHSDCAFMLFVQPGQTVQDGIRWMAAYPHVLVSLSPEDPAFAEAYAVLEAEKCLCCVHQAYSEGPQPIEEGSLVRQAMAHGCIFAFLFAQPGTEPEVRRQIHAFAAGTREAPQYPFFGIDYWLDIQEIDAVISDQGCCLVIDPQGRVYTNIAQSGTDENIHGTNIRDIILRVMPQTKGMGNTRDPSFG